MIDTTASWVSGLIFGGAKKQSHSTPAGEAASSTNSSIPRSIKPVDQNKLAAKLLYTSEDDWVVLDASGQSVQGDLSGDGTKSVVSTAQNTSNVDPTIKADDQAKTVDASPHPPTKPSRKSRKEASRLRSAKIAEENPVDPGILLLAAMRDRELKLSKTRKLACR